VQRWYLLYKQLGCPDHTDHMRRKSDFVAARFSDLDEGERELQKDIAQVKVPLAVQEKLLLKRNCFTLSNGRLQYLHLQMQSLNDNCFICCKMNDKRLKEGRAKTPAEKLLARFDTYKDASYVAIYAEFDSEKLTIRKRTKNGGKHYVEEVDMESLKDNVGNVEMTA
jgi:hypothetical protein